LGKYIEKIPIEQYRDGNPNRINLGKFIFHVPSLLISFTRYSRPNNDPSNTLIRTMADKRYKFM
jgi:hypothetical protein